MNFGSVRIGILFFVVGILSYKASGSGHDWNHQGEDQWNQRPLISSNAGPTRNDQGYPIQTQNNNAGNWNPGDAQNKDSDSFDSKRNQRPGRTWDSQDSQVKDDGSWNNNNIPRGAVDYRTANNQAQGQNSGANQVQPGPSWSPGDSQQKDNTPWNSGSGNQGRGWRPDDSQIKDGSTSNNRMHQSGQSWGTTDVQVKEWSNQRNQISSGSWGSTDAQVKDSGVWNAGANPPPGSWRPEDSQIKDIGNENRDGSRQPNGGSWRTRDEQVKVTPTWDQGQQKIPVEPIDSNLGSGWNPNNRDDTPIDMPIDDVFRPTGNGQDQTGDVGYPGPSQQGTFGNEQSQGNVGENVNPGVGPMGQDGVREGDYGTNTDNQRGDVGMIDGFPVNNGRVPQGNYKGGDSGRYPGDDPSQWRLEDSIPGTPGVDYPNFNTIPATGFDCKQHEHPGYYGDVEARCQVFHICQADGRHDSFLCPLGTIFNQQYFVCVWWFNFNCDDTVMYYDLNADLYKGGHGQGNYKGEAYTTPASVTTGIVDRPDYVENIDRQDMPGPGTGITGDRGVIGTPEQGIGITGNRDVIRTPGQGTGFTGDRGIAGVTIPGNVGGSGQSRPDTGRRLDEPVTPIPIPPTNFQGPSERPTTPEVREGGGFAGNGIESPQQGWKPDEKRNQGNGKRNWGSGQDVSNKEGKISGNQDGKWNRKGYGGDPAHNRGVKGGTWGGDQNSGKFAKNRFWEGDENFQGDRLEKRYGSNPNTPYSSQESNQMIQSHVPVGSQGEKWLTRSYLVNKDDGRNGNSQEMHEDVHGAGSSTNAQKYLNGVKWKRHNEVLGSSNERMVITNSPEVISQIPKQNGNRNTWLTYASVIPHNEKRKAPPLNDKKKWWKEAILSKRDSSNFHDQEKKLAAQEIPQMKTQKNQRQENGDIQLDGLNVYFDLNKDYTSDKTAKQRIWTLL